MDANNHNGSNSSNAMQRKAIIAKLKASGISSRTNKQPFEEQQESSSDEQEYNFEKIKTFHIPRKKEQQDSKDILTDLPLQSREFTHTLYPAIKSSFFYSYTSRKLKITKAQLVNNQALQKEFLEKKKDMKDDGRTEKELAECYGYICASNQYEVDKLCENGILAGNTDIVSLGKPSMGVYICKHADIITPIALEGKDSGYIVVFKIIKGKGKLVTECRGSTTTQEPTPLFDSHVTKIGSDGSKTAHIRAYQSLQYYIYEYGELDTVNRPRQVLPHAVLHYTYSDKDDVIQRRESYPSIMDTATDSDRVKRSVMSINEDLQTFCLWEGKLLVKGGTFCKIEMKTDVDTAVNIAFLDKHLKVKDFLPLEKFAKQIPPTLLNKSGKKHNVIYRGRHYNIFTLVPSDESGYGKFRQLIAHLVQHSAIAVVPLRMSSCMYLLARSNLTTNKMGLVPPSGDGSEPATQFLYVLVVTPKSLTSKINDQKLYNLMSVRKKRDSQSESRIPEELEQKLRAMNIESGTAVGSTPSEQITKLLAALKDKKRLQTSEKLVHHFYKDNEKLLATKQGHGRFSGKVGALWATTCQTRQEYYKPKQPKEKKSILKPDAVVGSKLEVVVKSTQSYKPSSMDMDQEATFSAEEGSDGETPKIPPSTSIFPSTSVDPRSRNPSFDQQVKISSHLEKRKLSLEETGKDPAPPTKILRPSFKPLDEVLFADNTQELILHPDFAFSERFEKTHRVAKGHGFPAQLDLEQENQMSVSFRQQVPFAMDKDCPYACDGDPLIKSMIRAVYGPWEEETKGPTFQEEREKVLWVRQVLHLKKNKQLSSDPRTAALVLASEGGDRTIVDERPTSTHQDSSPPSAPGSCSTDSGFASSSTTTTPNIVVQQSSASSSIHDLASMIASVLQDNPSSGNLAPTSDKSNGDVKTTTQNILQALVKTVDESGLDVPRDLRDIMSDLVTSADGTDQVNKEQGNQSSESSIELGTPSPSTTTSSPHSVSMEAKHGDPQSSYQRHPKASGHPQDPRLNKSGRSLRRLPLPSYRFPPSEKATELLPKDEEAAQFPLSLSRLENTSREKLTPRTPKAQNLFHKTTGTAVSPGVAAGKSQSSTLAALIRNSSTVTPMNRIFPTAAMTRTTRGATANKCDTSSNDLQGTRNPGPGSTMIGSKVSLHTAKQSDLHLRLFEYIQNVLGKSDTLTKNDLIRVLQMSGVTPAIQADLPRDPNTGILRGATGPGMIRGKSAGAVSGSSGQTVLTTDDNMRTKRKIINNGLDATELIQSNAVVPGRFTSSLFGRFATSAVRKKPAENFTIKFYTSEAGSSAPDASSTAKVLVTSQSEILEKNKSVGKVDFEGTTTTLSLVSAPSLLSPLSTSGSTKEAITTVSPSSATSTGISELSASDIKRIREKHIRAKKQRMQQFLQAQKAVRGDKKSSSAKLKAITPEQMVDVNNNNDRVSSSESDKLKTSSENVMIKKSGLIKNVAPTTAVITPTPLSVRQSPALQAEVVDEAGSSTPITSAIVSQQGVSMQVSANSGLDTKNVFSEIDNILTSVRNVQQGNAPTEALSSRLLQLALQLRNNENSASTFNPNSAATASQLPVSTGISVISHAESQQTNSTSAITASQMVHTMESFVPPSGVVCVGGTTLPPGSQTVSRQDTTAVLPSSPNLATVGMPIQTIGNQSVPNINVNLEPQDHVIEESVFPTHNSVCMVETAYSMSASTYSQQSIVGISPNLVSIPLIDADLLDEDRDVHTPTQDDTYNSNSEERIKASLKNSYNMFRPLSFLLQPAVQLSDGINCILQRIDHRDDTLQLTEARNSTNAQNHIGPLPTKDISANVQSEENVMSAESYVLQDWDTKIAPSFVEAKQMPASSQKLQKVALVKPQPFTPVDNPSFYVFNPRGHADCDEIESLLLITKGVSFYMQHVSEVIKNSCSGDDANDSLVPVTRDLLDKSLTSNSLWVIIRSVDMELMPALPYLSMLKCAGRKVQFVQADTADDVNAHRYSNILNGEHGILMPVSIDVMLQNRAVFFQLINWMSRLGSKTNKPVWRIALYKHITNQLHTLRDRLDVDTNERQKVSDLINLIDQNSDIVIHVSAKEQNLTDISTSEVFDTAIELQMRFVKSTRHIVVLTENDQVYAKWKTHRRAGVAVATVYQFIRAVMDDKNERANLGKQSLYSPLMKIYRVEK